MPSVKILIDLDTDTGRIQMHGPLDNELLLLRLLNRAAGMVVQYNVDRAKGVEQSAQVNTVEMN